MEIQDYISSGILESYVLGLATPEESELVLKLMGQYPEVRAEIEKIEEALLNYAEHAADKPSASVKAKLLSQISNETQEKIIVHPAAKQVKATSENMRYLIAASVTLFFVSAAINFYLYNNWQQAEQKIVALNADKVQLAQDFNVQQSQFKEMENNLSFLQSPYNKPVLLKGLPLSPNAMAMVYWNTQTHVVYINTQDLPTPPAGKQYQLWALAGGQPIDAGVFEVNDSVSMQKMKTIINAEAFAVTLENSGGSATPTMTAMYLMGAIAQL